MDTTGIGSSLIPRWRSSATALAVLAVMLVGAWANSDASADRPPSTLFQTGLYADREALVVDARNLAFAPQYPLWTDGATKRRWVSLPPDTRIDASDVDGWKFPVGTRFWKEFSFRGHPVETRFMKLQNNGQWLYAAYQWSSDGRTAALVQEKGLRQAFPLGNGKYHAIPGTTDCKVCHQGGPSEVLGFSALQLSPVRDPNALHAGGDFGSGLTLDYLIKNGQIIGYDRWPSLAPVIDAASDPERTVLGYLHGNCGHCHNSRASLANLGMFLRQELLVPGHATLDTTVGRPVKKSAPGQSAEARLRIDPGHPERSVLFERLSSRNPSLQMPPLGTVVVDDEAVALVKEWILELGANEGHSEGGT